MGIREGLLALLADAPKYGYQLKIEFETATGEAWPLNVGQVYSSSGSSETASSKPTTPTTKAASATGSQPPDATNWWSG